VPNLEAARTDLIDVLGVEAVLADPLALQPPELVDNQPQHFAGRVRPRVGLGLEVAAVLQRVHVGLRAIGEPALGAQHLVQPVAPLAPEDADGEVDRHVIRMRPRDSEVSDPHFGLH